MYQTRADLSGEEVSISVYDVDNQILSDSVHCHDRHEILLVTNGLGSWRMGELEGVFGPGFLFVDSETRTFLRYIMML